MNLNQKQREYLTKRLQSLAVQKKASFKVEEPNLEPFMKKLKSVTPEKIFAILHKEVKPSIYRPWHNGVRERVDGFVKNSHSIGSDDFYSNFKEIQKEAEEFCKKHYKVFDERLKSIDDRCQEYCDKIVFAETYDEALKIISEFTKF